MSSDEAMMNNASCMVTEGPSICRTFSSESSKVCRRCSAPYTGFGEECPRCRKSGQRGSVSRCNDCGSFFRGYGAVCEDCRGEQFEEFAPEAASSATAE